MKKIVIIGATAAGTVVAANLSRRGGEEFQHVVYEKRSYASLGGCGIPFFVGGHDGDDAAKSLVARTVEKHIENGVNIKSKHEVISVDFNAKTIVVKNLDTNEEFEDTYDELFIGTGASPIVPEWEGRNASNVLTSTSLEDAKALRAEIVKEEVKNVVIIGAGFIGVELAENFHEYGKKVTLIDAAELPMSRTFDDDITEKLVTRFNEVINWKPGEKVSELVTEGEKVTSVKTDKGSYDADLVIIAIGFRPQTSLFEGIDKLPNGAIIVNEYGQTSVKDVWSAGDCATVQHRVTGENVWIPLATTAGKLSTVVVNKMLGADTKFLGTLGTSGLKFGDVELFTTGITEKTAKAAGIEVKTTMIETNDCASYSGIAKTIFVKLIAKMDGTLVGAQSFGSNKSPSTRIAALAMAVWHEMNVKELTQFDFFYTPPFSRTTDVIHIAAKKLAK